MVKRLYIDLDICAKCDECGSLCSYALHPGNNGITSLRELAHFAVICRRCDDAPCVASCPWRALEMQGYNRLKRYMMRCTSCKSCSQACPFGTIYPETIPLVTAGCDYCIGRLKDTEAPICLQSCAHGGVKYGEFEENAEGRIYNISEHIVVKTEMKWERAVQLPLRKK